MKHSCKTLAFVSLLHALIAGNAVAATDGSIAKEGNTTKCGPGEIAGNYRPAPPTPNDDLGMEYVIYDCINIKTGNVVSTQRD